MDLSGDEAFYWVYSTHLGINYYEKGPVIGWLISLGTIIFGDNVLGVRGLGVVLSFGCAMLLCKLAKRLHNPTVGIWAAVLFTIAPIFASMGVSMSIDPPFIFLWILSMLLLHIAVKGSSPWPWLALGLALGLGLLTKFTIAFFYVCALLWMVTSPDGRRQLKRPWPWIAIISLAAMIPIIHWNSQHDWVNFRHNLAHTKMAKGFALASLKDFGEFIGSQLLILTPLLSALGVYAAVKLRRQDRFSFWFCVPVLAFFLLKSLQGKVEANWPMMAYLTCFIAFGAFFLQGYSRFNIHIKRLINTTIIIAAVGCGVAHYVSAFVPVLPLPQKFNLSGLTKDWRPLPPDKDPTRLLKGWQELGQSVGNLAKSMDKPCFIFSHRYQVAAELAFYVPGHPTTYCVSIDRRMNQYDLWPGLGQPDLLHQDAIFVTYEQPTLDPRVAAAFDSYQSLVIPTHDRYGRPAPTFYVYICRNFRGLVEDVPKKF
jgi:undecaprenyl-diphosphatase